MKTFTTGQAARICHVSPRTVSKWVDTGKLKAFRVPGSQDRRIPGEYLIAFLKKHNMPLGNLEDERLIKIIIVSQDQYLIENLKQELPAKNSFRVSTAANGFEAGMISENSHPDSVIVDFAIGPVAAAQLCRNLRSRSDFTKSILIALLTASSIKPDFDHLAVNETFEKPFDPALLASRLRTLISAAKKELI